MVTAEKIKHTIAKSLTEDPLLRDVSSIQVAPLVTSAQDVGVLVIIRTAPQLSGIIAQCQPYDYAASMPRNIARCFAPVADYYGAGELLPLPNELMALVIGDMWQMERRGFAQNEAASTITSPRVPLKELRQATDPAVRKQLLSQLGNWGQLLISLPWYGTKALPGVPLCGIDFVHLPDLPPDDLALAHYERAAQMSSGWNFAATASDAALQGRAAELRQALAMAQTIATY